MRYLLACAALTATLGTLALFEAAYRPSWIDSAGFLHEPFAWMASGRILFLITAALVPASGAAWLVRRRRGRPAS